MDAIVQQIAQRIGEALGPSLAVFLLSIIPIAEARVAIPFGIDMGLTPVESFGWAFLGSSLMAPILIIIFIPIINALSRTKLFSRVGKFLYDKFEKKSKGLSKTISDTQSDAPQPSERSNKFRITSSDLKKMGGTAIFVAIPLPLTGVWTGSAVASILKIGFIKSVIGVVIGNAVACAVITLISYLFKDYISWITLSFFVIAVAAVVFLIVKFILYKPSEEQSSTDENNTDID